MREREREGEGGQEGGRDRASEGERQNDTVFLFFVLSKTFVTECRYRGV